MSSNQYIQHILTLTKEEDWQQLEGKQSILILHSVTNVLTETIIFEYACSFDSPLPVHNSDLCDSSGA